MSKKTTVLRNKLVELLKTIEDEALLTSLLVITHAAQTPSGLAELTAKAAKAPKPPKPTQTLKSTGATKGRLIEYMFQEKPMIAFQTEGKPDEALLATLRKLKEEKKIRYYFNVPVTPFGNKEPFWAGKADEATKATLMAVA